MEEEACKIKGIHPRIRSRCGASKSKRGKKICGSRQQQQQPPPRSTLHPPTHPLPTLVRVISRGACKKNIGATLIIRSRGDARRAGNFFRLLSASELGAKFIFAISICEQRVRPPSGINLSASCARRLPPFAKALCFLSTFRSSQFFRGAHESGTTWPKQATHSKFAPKYLLLKLNAAIRLCHCFCLMFY